MQFVFFTMQFLLIIICWQYIRYKSSDYNNKFNVLHKWDYVITSICSLILSLNVGLIVFKFFSNKPQVFSEFSSGTVAFSTSNKDIEYITLSMIILSFIVFMNFLLILFRKTYEFRIESMAREILLYSMIPAFIMFGQALRFPETINLSLLALISIAAGIFSIIITTIAYIDKSLDTVNANKIAKSIVLVVFMGVVGFFGIALFLSRYVLGDSVNISPSIIIGTGCFFASLSIVIALKARSSFITSLKMLLLIYQLPVSLTFFILLSPPVLSLGGDLNVLTYRNTLMFLVAVLIGITLVDIIRRIIIKSENENQIEISPWSLIAILVFLQSANIGWPSIASDFYHAGEFYLPWWLLEKFGYLPFVDYQPARGIANYIPGLLTRLFSDGTFASQSIIVNLHAVPFIIIGFFGVRLVFGNLVAFLSVSSFWAFAGEPGGGMIIGFSYLFVLYAFWPSHIKRNYYRWLLTWLVGGYLIVLYMVAEGSAIVIATLPAAAYVFYEYYKYDKKQMFKLASILTISSVIILIATPLGSMTLGVLRYLIEQSGTNAASYGINWNLPSEVNNRGTLGYAWQYVRFSWLIVLAVGIVFLNYKKNIDKKTFFTAIGIIIISLIIIPRAAGRIDSIMYSRPFATSLYFISMLLPFFIFHKSIRNKASMIVVYSILIGIIGYQTPIINTAIKHHQYILHEPTNVIDMSSIGFDVVGKNNVLIDSNILNNQVNIRGVLSELLEPEETYLDLTNNNANYGFQNKPNPILETAFYNMPTEAQGIRALNTLKNSPPILALVSSHNVLHDGGTLSIRNWLLYKYVIENYTPFKDEYNNTWMIANHKIDRLLTFPKYSIYLLMNDQDKIELIDDVFNMYNLLGLPASWGASKNSLDKKMAEVMDVLNEATLYTNNSINQLSNNEWAVSDHDPHFIYSFLNTKDAISGGDAGLLYLEFENVVEGSYFQVFWTNEIANTFSERQSIKFNAGSSQYIIPLDSAPSWLKGGDVTQLRVDLPDEYRGNVIVNEMILYKRSATDDYNNIDINMELVEIGEIIIDDLHKGLPERNVSVVNFTDDNWDSGINKTDNILLFKNTFKNRITIQNTTEIVTEDSTRYIIEKIDENSDWIYVFVLDVNKDKVRYPNKLSFIRSN